MSSELPSLPSVDAARPVDSTPPSPWRRPSAVIAAVAVALLGWQWLETRSRLADLQDELARRLTDSDTAADHTSSDGHGPDHHHAGHRRRLPRPGTAAPGRW